jgi:8-oxoguanine deaminase
VMTPEKRTWLKNPLAIYTADESPATGGVVIEGDKVDELLETGRKPSRPVDDIFDARDHVIIPGLINTHHHFYQTLTRAFPAALNKPLFPWLQSLYPVWAGLTPDMVDLSSRLALYELLLSGCTTAADHHYLFPAGLEDAMDVQAAAFAATGVRGVITRGSMCLGQDQGGLPPNQVVQSEDDILADSERVIARHHDAAEGAMLQIALAPCSPFSVTPQVMRDSATLAQQHNVRLHTHLAETTDETAFCQQAFGMSPLDYLESVGWLHERVWLAHGIHFDETEIARLGKNGVGICHCPSSNMILASGICPVPALENAGAPVGLGVDGSASNDGSNMIQELRMAFLLQRLQHGAEVVTHESALRWATQGSARCLGRQDIGEIAPGKRADLALYKLDELRFSGSGDPLAALILCGAHKADHVMVAGQWRVTRGELPGVDIEKLQTEHRRAAARLAASAAL